MKIDEKSYEYGFKEYDGIKSKPNYFFTILRDQNAKIKDICYLLMYKFVRYMYLVPTCTKHVDIGHIVK